MENVRPLMQPLPDQGFSPESAQLELAHPFSCECVLQPPNEESEGQEGLLQRRGRQAGGTPVSLSCLPFSKLAVPLNDMAGPDGSLCVSCMGTSCKLACSMVAAGSQLIVLGPRLSTVVVHRREWKGTVGNPTSGSSSSASVATCFKTGTL